jgi:hypothetical protein
VPRLVSLLASFGLLYVGTILLLWGLHLDRRPQAAWVPPLAFSQAALAYWGAWGLRYQAISSRHARRKKKGKTLVKDRHAPFGP